MLKYKKPHCVKWRMINFNAFILLKQLKWKIEGYYVNYQWCVDHHFIIKPMLHACTNSLDIIVINTDHCDRDSEESSQWDPLHVSHYQWKGITWLLWYLLVNYTTNYTQLYSHKQTIYLKVNTDHTYLYNITHSLSCI